MILRRSKCVSIKTRKIVLRAQTTIWDWREYLTPKEVTNDRITLNIYNYRRLQVR